MIQEFLSKKVKKANLRLHGTSLRSLYDNRAPADPAGVPPRWPSIYVGDNFQLVEL